MKFLHTSDIHFGAGRRLTPRSLDYLKRHQDTLDGILKLALKEKVDFALVSGDIFDNSQTTIEEFLAARAFFTALGEICPTVVTAGNHDETKVGSFQVDYLNQLKIDNVSFASEPKSFTFGDASVLACPWVGIKDQEAFDAWLLRYYRNEEIVMLHECFYDIVTDSGYRAKSGVVPPPLVGVKAYALGDIHKYQKVKLSYAFYSGAPLQYTFGESPEKGCIIWTRTENEYTPVFKRIPQPIELKVVYALDQIPEHTKDWYQLRVPANQIPTELPACVKDVTPLPLELGQVESHSETHFEQIEVDYTEGVMELLQEAQYTSDETDLVVEEIKRLCAV